MNEYHSASAQEYHCDTKQGATVANVGDIERWVSGIAGGTLVACGLGMGGARGVLGILAGGSLLYRAWSGHCWLYETLNIDTAHAKSSRAAVPAQQGARVNSTIVIDVPAERLYRHWRVLSNLPSLLPALESVREIDPIHSHWTARTPLGASIKWDAEIIEDRFAEVISWRSMPNSELDSAGSVRFQSLGDLNQSMLTLTLKYNPPGGTVVAKVAEFLGMGMNAEVEAALQRFKHEMEDAQTRVPAALGKGDPSSSTE
jgi:uncharacterized membrane protein